MTAGIYEIRDIQTGALYVGASHDIEERWRAHRSAFRRHRPQNAKLQTAWDNGTLEFSILEQTEPSVKALNAAERRWIDHFRINGHIVHNGPRYISMTGTRAIRNGRVTIATLPRLSRLRELRTRAALTQVELAQRANVARTTIVRLEQGDPNVLPTTLRKLAKALRVKPTDLWEEPR